MADRAEGGEDDRGKRGNRARVLSLCRWGATLFLPPVGGCLPVSLFFSRSSPLFSPLSLRVVWRYGGGSDLICKSRQVTYACARDDLFAPCASRKWRRAGDRPKVGGVRPCPRPLDGIARARAGDDCDTGGVQEGDPTARFLDCVSCLDVLFFFPLSSYACVARAHGLLGASLWPGRYGRRITRPNSRWGHRARRRWADAGSRHSGSRGARPARQTRARQTGQRSAGRNRTRPVGCRRAPA